MYQELILVILIILIIFYILNNDTRVNVEAYKQVYKVRPLKKDDDPTLLQKKANFLKEINDKSQLLVENMKNNKYPSKEISNRLYDRFKNTIINETPPNETGAAYTINKGPINICILKKDNTFHDLNDAFFVILHELAHVMSLSYGHGEEFQENFDYIVKYAIKLNLWIDKEYEKNSTNYCGVEITSSPCDNDGCSKNNLDSFFKESLLEN